MLDENSSVEVYVAECDSCENTAVDGMGMQIMETSGDKLCDECYTDHGALCTECDLYEYTDLMVYIDVISSHVCQACFDSHYFECNNCSEVRASDDMYESEDGDICHDCHSDQYIECMECATTVHNDNAHHGSAPSGYDLQVCDACFDNEFGYCASCDAITYYGDLDTYDRCDNCAQSETAVHDYSYKPSVYARADATDLHHKELVFMGVELEVEARDKDDVEDYAQRLIDTYGDENYGENSAVLWATEDGSLDCGLELVSQPATLNYHVNSYMWKKECRYMRDNGWTSHDTSTCGLHVHVNRNSHLQHHPKWSLLNSPAEGGMTITDGHQAKIMFFTHSQEELLTQLGRRNSSFGRFDKDKKLKKLDKGGSAYNYRDYDRHAVCFANRNTIEFRFPKGTLIPDTLYATLEMIDAIVRFTKFYSSARLSNIERTHKHFLDFASDPRNDYPYLSHYINERSIQ